MKDSDSPITGVLANVSNRGWWRLGTDMARRGRGREILERTHDVWKWAWRLCHLWKFSQGWLPLTDDHQVTIKSMEAAPLWAVIVIFFYVQRPLGCLQPWFSSLYIILIQSGIRMLLTSCLGIQRPVLEEKLRTENFCGSSKLLPSLASQTSKHSWAGCVGFFDNLSLHLTPSVQKNFLSDLLKNLKAHKY